MDPEPKPLNLKLKVHLVRVILDKTKIDGSRLRVAEAIVGDATGCIIATLRNGPFRDLFLWHLASPPGAQFLLIFGRSFQICSYSYIFLFVEQIDAAQPGSLVEVRNAKIEMLKGYMRLVVDKWGRVAKSADTPSFTVNLENNLSSVEYELVEDPSAPQQ